MLQLPLELWLYIDYLIWLQTVTRVHDELLQCVAEADPVKKGFLLVRSGCHWLRWRDVSTPITLQWGLTGPKDYAYSTLHRHKLDDRWNTVSYTMYKNFQVRRAAQATLSYQAVSECEVVLDGFACGVRVSGVSTGHSPTPDPTASRA